VERDGGNSVVKKRDCGRNLLRLQEKMVGWKIRAHARVRKKKSYYPVEATTGEVVRGKEKHFSSTQRDANEKGESAKHFVRKDFFS